MLHPSSYLLIILIHIHYHYLLPVHPVPSHYVSHYIPDTGIIYSFLFGLTAIIDVFADSALPAAGIARLLLFLG